MKYFDLIFLFGKYTVTNEWDKLRELITDDFYMTSAINHVIGADNYIEFERNRSLIFCQETLHFFESVDKTEYYHIYKITYIEPTVYEMIAHETFGIKNNLISYAVRDGNFSDMPTELLNRSTLKS
ncbi:MAG: hypothetical protein HRU28_16215 [Rhizobiales bacterium]|nr:hypothetical protein [Hyphomicrobiales bacterium]